MDEGEHACHGNSDLNHSSLENNPSGPSDSPDVEEAVGESLTTSPLTDQNHESNTINHEDYDQIESEMSEDIQSAEISIDTLESKNLDLHVG